MKFKLHTQLPKLSIGAEKIIVQSNIKIKMDAAMKQYVSQIEDSLKDELGLTKDQANAVAIIMGLNADVISELRDDIKVMQEKLEVLVPTTEDKGADDGSKN